MIKDIGQIELELDSKIPRSAVSERDGGGGRRLSYLEGHYVIDRLNKIFGPLRWALEMMDVREVVNRTSKGEFPAYLVKVRLTVGFGEGGTVSKEAYGYGSDKSSQNAHELAIKEARTDALKVAAKDLGMSMGLALYDRSQENVSDDEVENISQPKIDAPKKPVEKAASKTEAKTGDIDETIRSYVRIGISKKSFSAEDFSKHIIATFDKQKLADLDATQKQSILDYLREKTK